MISEGITETMNLIDVVESRGIRYERLTPKQAFQIERKWLDAFASRVFDATGKWVYRGIRWHGFSWNFQPCLEKRRALEAYFDQAEGPYFIFDEDLRICLRCRSARYPDFSNESGIDFYVVPETIDWTMVFTHEELNYGPFFAWNIAPQSGTVNP